MENKGRKKEGREQCLKRIAVLFEQLERDQGEGGRRAGTAALGARPAAIVYCNWPKTCDFVTDALRKLLPDVQIDAYHGKLSNAGRLLTAWREGKIQIMVATSGFGLGLDNKRVVRLARGAEGGIVKKTRKMRER